MYQQRFIRLGLTGGIGAGKSTVAAELRRARIPVLDLDIIGKMVTESPAVLPQVATLCPECILPTGELDRSALRKRALSEPQFLTRLEALLHPAIWKEFELECEKLQEAGYRLVVCEAALLIDKSLHKHLDGLIVVSAPEPVRRERLKKRGGLTDQEITGLLSKQISEADRVRAATIILENRGSEADLIVQVNALVQKWREEGLVP